MGVFGMIYFIIPTYDKPQQLTKTLKVISQSGLNYRVLIVNSGGRQYEERINECCYFLNYELLNCNGYFAKAINTAYDWIATHYNKGYFSKKDIVIIMNDDNTFDDDFLSNMLNNLEKNSLVCAKGYETYISGLVEHIETGKQRIEKQYVEGIIGIDWNKLKFSHNILYTKYVTCSTRCICLYARDFLNIGKFSRLIPHYLSDYDWVIRAVKYGLKLKEDGELEILKQDRNFPMFSIKNPGNPIFFTIFILKHCPFYLIPLNAARVWTYSIVKIFRKLNKTKWTLTQ